MNAARIGRVLLWMSGTLLSFSALAVSIRYLAGALSVFEILTVRSVVSIAILLTLCLIRPNLRADLTPRRLGLNVLRNAIHFVSQYAWALSITLLPFATVFALEFTTPAWVMLLAALTLGEHLTISRLGVVVCGIIGVLVILRPGLSAFQPEAMLVLAAAFGFSVFKILTKRLTATESAFDIVLLMNMMKLPMALAGSDPDFLRKLEPGQIPFALSVGVAGLSAHYCLANAFRAGDASLVIPLDFVRLPLIAVVGWLLFGESVDLLTLIGAAIIFCGIFWNLRAEARKS